MKRTFSSLFYAHRAVFDEMLFPRRQQLVGQHQTVCCSACGHTIAVFDVCLIDQSSHRRLHSTPGECWRLELAAQEARRERWLQLQRVAQALVNEHGLGIRDEVIEIAIREGVIQQG